MQTLKLCFGSVTKACFPSLPQHHGHSGGATGEHGLEETVTFKSGTFLDNLGIHDSREQSKFY